MGTNVGVYARISDARDDDTAGVGRQEADCRSLAGLRGWTVGRVYVDNDVSAFKRGVVRPAFEEMLSDLENGTIDGIVSYDLDRFARRPSDLERAIDLYDHKRAVFATVQGDIDLSSADGRTMARVLVAFANKSSMDTSRRVARKQLELAQAGKDGGGGHRPYGYTHDRKQLVESEAAVLREVVRRVLDTESLTSICVELNERGVPMPGPSNRWQRGVLKRMLLRPRLAGLRVYKGAVLLDDQGQPVKGAWPAIIKVDQHEQLKAVLGDEARNFNAGRIDRKYLLSGILRCPCGTKMYGVTKHGKPNYVCPSLRGCGKTHRRAEPLDEHVTELVLEYLERQEVDAAADIEPDVAKFEHDIAEAERSLASLIKEWSSGRMSDPVFYTAQAQKEAQVTALKRQRQSQRRLSFRSPVGEGVRAAWEAANVSQRRAMVSEVLLAVNVLAKPVTAPKRFDANYYVPLFRRADA